MATTHLLLAMARRAAAESSGAAPLAGRTALSFELDVARITGALTVVCEASATGDDDSWDALATVSPTESGRTPTAVVAQPFHRYARARIAAIDSATLEARLVAPFMDPVADASLFTKELRAFGDGFARIVAEAEEAVMSEILKATRKCAVPVPFATPLATPIPIGAAPNDNPYLPTLIPVYTAEEAERLAGTPGALELTVTMDLPGFGDTMRAAIVLQAEHLFHRHKLQLSDEAAALVSLRAFPEIAPGLTRVLSKYANTALSVWRGR